jgi:hypothetical protein
MEKRYKIGTTKIADYPSAKIKFRIAYPDDSGGTVSEVISNEKKAKEHFEAIKKEAGDIHLYICLVKKNGEAIDEEVIDSFWDGETNN